MQCSIFENAQNKFKMLKNKYFQITLYKKNLKLTVFVAAVNFFTQEQNNAGILYEKFLSYPQNMSSDTNFLGIICKVNVNYRYTMNIAFPSSNHTFLFPST